MWRVTGARMLAALDLPQPVIMLLARWGSDAILKYVADAPLSRLTEAYLERVQAASAVVLGTVPSDAPAALSAAPNYSADALALADSSATSVLSVPTLRTAPARFATNDCAGSRFVHIIASRQAWERPKPGRTVCGWDYVSQHASLFPALPLEFKRCGKCASPAGWARFNEPPSSSESD